MERRQLNTLEAARRAQAFLDAFASVLDGRVARSLRKRLDRAVEILTRFHLEQVIAQGLARGETANRLACRRDVYLGLIRPIGRIADCAFGASRQRCALVMSEATVRGADFMKCATRLADVAEAYSVVFVSQGMPADFVDRLRAALSQISASIDAQEEHKRRQVMATAGLKIEAKSVRGTLRVIDALLRPTLRDHPALFADWIRRGRQPDGARQQRRRNRSPAPNS